MKINRKVIHYQEITVDDNNPFLCSPDCKYYEGISCSLFTENDFEGAPMARHIECIEAFGTRIPFSITKIERD